MCGFVGYCGAIDQRENEIITKMSDTISHRGPDSRGYYTDERIALGFCRLSIIDLKSGDQPQKSFDGRFVIVFNGEIYNYRELRRDLSEQYGISFRTDSDTETIVAAYTVFGNNTAEKLRGMFAFVIYDCANGNIYGARDPFGIKPFYFAKQGSLFCFASEIKAILAHPDFIKTLNRDALKTYLTFQYSAFDETFFKDVFKLAPGSYFELKQSSMVITKYFESGFSGIRSKESMPESMIDSAVRSSVLYHGISDVEVGAFLSGGVDSSYIVALSQPDKTFSVGFRNAGFDETENSDRLCKLLGIKANKAYITPDDFFSALHAVQYHSDEPHANLSAVPLYFLAKEASKQVKVVLSGEGADELFGGYDAYVEGRVSAHYNHLPMFLRRLNGSLFGSLPSTKISSFFRANAKTLEDSYIGQAFIMDDAEANALLRSDYRTDISFRDVTKPYYERVKGCDRLTKQMYLDMNLWLPNDILLKADKMTMAHSLELRVPYLDKEVWDCARRLSSAQMVSGIHTKRSFRNAALNSLPEEWARRQKRGFMVPFREWIRDDKYCNIVRAEFESEYAGEFFDVKAITKLLDEHKTGTANNARKIYTILSFLIWYNEYFVNR